jgi:hypothetical protein
MYPENSLPFSEMPSIGLCLEPLESYPYTLISRVVSFIQNFHIKFCIHFLSLPCMLLLPLTEFSSMCPPLLHIFNEEHKLWRSWACNFLHDHSRISWGWLQFIYCDLYSCVLWAPVQSCLPSVWCLQTRL